MSKRKPMRVGQIVMVEFLDHCEGGDEAILFRVYGEVATVSRTNIGIDAWAYADSEQEHDDNETRFNIVRRAIVRWARLVEEMETSTESRHGTETQDGGGAGGGRGIGSTSEDGDPDVG